MFKRFFYKHGWKYIPGIAFLLLCSRLQTLLPLVLGDAIDGLEAGAAWDALFRNAAYLVAISLGVFVTRFLWRMFIIMNGRYMECFLREELFSHLQRLPVSFFAKRRSGDLIAYSINDIGAVRQTFGPSLAQALNSLATAVLSVISMAGVIDGRLTLFAMLPIPAALAGIVLLRRVVRRRSSRVQALFATLSGFVNESILGLLVLKTFVRENQWAKRHGEISDDMQTANEKLAFVSAVTTPFITVCFGLSYAVGLIYGSRLVLAGTLSLGGLTAFLSYLLLIQTPVSRLGQIINSLQKGLASYRRLRDIMDEPEIAAAEYEAPANGAAVPPLASVEAVHLRFAYEGEAAPALDDVSFRLEAGQTLGIAGETGSGKSTLLNLIMKLQTPEPGMLFLGGADVCGLSARSIRDAVGYVPQDGFLFSASIAENISFYCPDATPEAVREAAALAGIHREIMAFPAGYDTQVGERGTHLSGGQKQRLALARALVKDPELLILDDTLSAVDSVTEQEILENIRGVLSHKTAVLVSHRLSALRQADLILWMQNGRVLESGTHEQLLAAGGAYAKTWARQNREDAGKEAALQ